MSPKTTPPPVAGGGVVLLVSGCWRSGRGRFRQLGLSRTYLNHVLTGRSPLPLDLLDRLAEALDLELELREKQSTP
ncbi:helix-turn-helix domain-containing protein [Deinococcus peraridilitoris]|uniref:Helix-turn-helix protein n=1 Tax=Deinococcus peraridilitoris (strain DSM 19664 / LMG 22246 / CIP 109416 / KR-200) TaxID=937777 RepID=L0A1H3_DEIPD|nr:helix-turn-helix domain-containing protein [Deinococcus peraridilitoris]AFZ67027.1 Helix-turn-helix protein [Deinococcus peraridilitoris DSM 19664]